MRRRLITSSVIWGLAGFGLSACEREITLEENINPATDFGEAQFDPTNPIPVLRIVPSPTALAERPAGDPRGPGLTVEPAPCERPSTKQCLAFVSGWPTTTPITVYFSTPLKDDTVKKGIKIFQRQGLSLAPVDYSFKQEPRPAPPPACMSGMANGSMPPTDYTEAQVPPGYQVVLTPTMPLEPGSTYVMLVESSADQDNLRSACPPDEPGCKADDKVIQPSALFSLLNAPSTPTPPVSAEGVINSALLRSNVQSLIIAAGDYDGRVYSDLTAEEKAEVDAAVTERARTGLFPLYTFFDQIIAPLAGAGVTARERLVYANAWHTAGATPEIEFDPANSKIPFPNVELMTRPVTTAMGLMDLQVSLPIRPCDPMMPTPGCDSPTGAALKGGLNTLNGFSTTAPIAVTTSANVDAASLEGRVFMYELDPMSKMIIGQPVPVAVRTSSRSDVAPSSIALIPIFPLKQNTMYVIGIKKGVKDTAGNLFQSPATFSFLKIPAPLVTPQGMLTEAANPILPMLQCSTASTKGRLATDEEVKGTAQAIENQLVRARWQTAFNAFEQAAAPAEKIMRGDLLMAWTVKTQDITGTMDLIKGRLLPMVWDTQVRGAAMLPRVQDTGFRVTGTAAIADFLKIADTFCLPACQAGALTGHPMCSATATVAPPTVKNHPICQGLTGMMVGNLGQIQRHMLTTYKVTKGSPYAGMGTFTQQTVGVPRPIRIPMWIVVPTGTAAASGFPIVMFQHGLTRQKEDGFFVANSFASGRSTRDPAGFATVLIDSDFHGERATDLINNQTLAPNLAIDPANVTCDQAGVCMGGADGVRDPSGAGYLSTNVFAVRDNFRQTVIDHLTLLHTLRTESMAGGPLDFLDGTRVAYVGQSLGGIQGGNFIGYAPELKAAVLNVPGGGLTNVLLGLPGRFAAALYAGLAAAGACTPVDAMDLTKGCRDTPAFRQFLVTAQWAIDPGDPLANSIAVREAHNMIPPLGTDNVLVQMVTPDKVVANPTTLALARAYGFNTMDSSATSHFQHYNLTVTSTSVDCHGFLLAPDPRCGGGLAQAVCATVGAQSMATRFVATEGADVGPRAPASVFGGAIQCPAL